MSAVLEAREASARYLEAVPPTLLRQFDLLATAPAGVARLRELILTLAVQGRLVPQRASDSPASELLSRSRAAAIEQRRQRRKSTLGEIAPVEPDEGSRTLPQGWVWCRGGDLYTVIRGVTYQKTDAGDSPRDSYLPILRANNIRATINFDDLVYVPQSLVSDEQLLRPGDFVVCLASGSKNLVGKAAMFTGEKTCSFGAFCGAIRVAVPLPFFSAFLASPLYRDAVSEASLGIGINNLKSSSLLGLAIALPPEAEQARIVARVDELMRLCDALEAKGRLEAEQHARLLGALLGTLTDSTKPDELAANWQRVAAHFDLLLDRPEAVDALEQTILQLAVRGLLVPQDPNDEPARALLKRIRTDKERLIAEGKIRQNKLQAPIGEEAAFPSPPGWETVQLGALIELVSGQHLGPSEYQEGVSAGIPYLTGPAEFGELSPVPTRSTAERRAVARCGDILITVKGSGVGKLNIVTHPEIAISRQLMAIRSLGANDQYLFLVLWSMGEKFQSQSVGIAIPGIGRDDVSGAVVGLPPLPEQARIVACVTELRHLCADLRQRLTVTQTTQAHLADALVEQAAA